MGWWNGYRRWEYEKEIKKHLTQNKNVLICIRDIEKNKNNPFSPEEVKANLEKELEDLIRSQKVKVIIIPDIESVNYGRGVGYNIIEHIPPENIGKISATEIRKKLIR